MGRHLGKQIKAFRAAKDITQEKAAVLLGISLATLQRIESGAAKGSFLTRSRIVKQIENLKEREAVAA